MSKITYYENKYKLDRKEFLKIYAYYTSLVFLTIFRDYKSKKFLIDPCGVDMITLEKDGFP